MLQGQSLTSILGVALSGQRKVDQQVGVVSWVARRRNVEAEGFSSFEYGKVFRIICFAVAELTPITLPWLEIIKNTWRVTELGRNIGRWLEMNNTLWQAKNGKQLNEIHRVLVDPSEQLGCS